MFCKNCGERLAGNEQFCKKCGTPVEKPVHHEPTPAITPTPDNLLPPAPPKNNNAVKGIIGLIVVLAVVWFVGGSIFGGTSKKEFREESELYVKDFVYNMAHEVPSMKSEVLYIDKKHQRAIVIVRFKCKEKDLSGSVAVKSTGAGAVVATMVNEYDASYKDSLEDLKAMFRLS